MSRGQRLGFLALAALIAVVAVVVIGTSGGDDTETTATSSPTAEPTAEVPQEASPAEEEPTPEPTPKPEPKPPLLVAGKEPTLEFKQGDTVRLRVRHDTAEHVHVHGYDIFKDLEPGKVATISFKADITGIFEIELEDSATPLAQLKVEP